jgi:hypothetical protein
VPEASSPEDGSGAARLPAPLRFTSVARHSWRLYRAHFGSLLRLYLLVHLALLPLALVAAAFLGPSDVSIQLQALALMVRIAAFTLVGSVAAAVTAVFLIDRIAGRPISMRVAWESLRGHGRDVVTTGLLASVISLILVLLLFYLGELMMPVAFGPPVVAHVLAVERRRLHDGWQRARDLGSREWGRLVMYLLTLGLAVLVAIIAVRIAIGETLRVLDVTEAAVESPVGIIASFGALHVLYALGWAFIAVAQTVIYLDLRARKDELTPERLAAERAELGPANPEADPSPD